MVGNNSMVLGNMMVKSILFLERCVVVFVCLECKCVER